MCLQFGPERSGIRCAAQARYTSQPYQQRPATQQRRLRLLVACLSMFSLSVRPCLRPTLHISPSPPRSSAQLVTSSSILRVAVPMYMADEPWPISVNSFCLGINVFCFERERKKKMNSLSVLLCSRILSLLTTTTLVHLGVSVPPGSCPAEVSSSRHRPPPALNDSGTLGFTPSAGGRVGDGRRWTSTTCQMLGPGREGRSREVPAVVPTGLWL